MPLELQKKLGEKEPFITKEETEKLNKIDSIVVISGTPIVNAEKASKLRSYFLKMLKDMGPIVNNEIFIPLNPTTGESTGYLSLSSLLDALMIILCPLVSSSSNSRIPLVFRR